jgi:outer membrane protein assembly factor BamB
MIYSGLDFNEGEGVGRAGLVALRFTGSSLQPLWKFDPESGQTFTGAGALTFDPDPRTDFGCGDVWTTPAVSGALVFIGVANCQHPDQAQQSGENWSEEMVAVSADDGTPAWSFRPDTSLAAAWADDDFGASPNVFTTARGAQLVGEGQKSAVYWARWRDAGAQAWSQLAGQPGHVTEGSPTSSGLAIGGFIGSTAVQTSGGVAQRIIGATALPVPDPTDPLSVDRSTWAVRALDPATGDILWKDRLAGPAYGAVSVAGGVVFVPDTFTDTLQALDASDGLPLAALPLGGPPSSTPVVAGDAVYVGAGTGEQGPTGSNLLGPASGIWAFGL